MAENRRRPLPGVEQHESGSGIVDGLDLSFHDRV